MDRTKYHDRPLRTLVEMQAFAQAIWRADGQTDARPRIQEGRSARTKRGSWHVRFGVASGVEGLRSTEKIIINTAGRNQGTVLHELAHAIHYRECEKDPRRMRAEGMHGHSFRRILARLERHAEVLVAA